VWDNGGILQQVAARTTAGYLFIDNKERQQWGEKDTDAA